MDFKKLCISASPRIKDPFYYSEKMGDWSMKTGFDVLVSLQIYVLNRNKLGKIGVEFGNTLKKAEFNDAKSRINLLVYCFLSVVHRQSFPGPTTLGEG
jgi:hypothetical protein